jgi:hypothetical protein
LSSLYFLFDKPVGIRAILKAFFDKSNRIIEQSLKILRFIELELRLDAAFWFVK